MIRKFLMAAVLVGFLGAFVGCCNNPCNPCADPCDPCAPAPTCPVYQSPCCP